MDKLPKHFFNDLNNVKKYFSPGRVNIIGEHLDYNGGSVFPAAISLGIYGYIEKRDDTVVKLKSSDFDSEIVINLNKELKYNEKISWANYPLGVISELKKSGYLIEKGYNLYFHSTLPKSSGLSSSAAIEVLTAYMIIHDTIDSEKDRIEIAQLSKNAENKFVGVNCGIMDQFAIAMGKRDRAILLNTDNLEYSYIPFKLDSYRLVIMNSNKSRMLAESKFNERRDECERAFNIIKSNRLINNLSESTLDDLKFLSDDILIKRTRHVITENQRVKNSVKFLEDNNISGFGREMTESHLSLKKDYEVSCLELDTLINGALDSGYCVGARMTGAGFGGCAIALVEEKRIDEFSDFVGVLYKKETGLDADFYNCEISDGVHEIGE